MKTIDRQTYLQALGLFTLATMHMRKVEESQKALSETLGLEYNSANHVEDEIYSPTHGFDGALKLAGITVADDPAQ